MAKPTLSDCEWSTTATISGSPDSGSNGLSTKDDPGLAVRQAGAIPGTGVRARTLNFLFNQFYKWAQYVNALHSESDFLSQNYTWTGTHKFSQPIGSQGNVLAGGEFRYADGSYAPTVRSRVIAIPLDQGVSNTDIAGAAKATYNQATGVWTSISASAQITFSLRAYTQVNNIITRVRVAVLHNGAPGTGASLAIHKRTVDPTSSSTPSTSAVTNSSETAATTTGAKLLDTDTTSAVSETVSSALDEYFVKVELSDNASGDELRWLVLSVSDAGPRLA